MPLDFENVGPARQGTEYKSGWGELINVGAQSWDWGFEVLEGANPAARRACYISVGNNSLQ